MSIQQPTVVEPDTRQDLDAEQTAVPCLFPLALWMAVEETRSRCLTTTATSHDMKPTGRVPNIDHEVGPDEKPPSDPEAGHKTVSVWRVPTKNIGRY